MAFLHCSFFFKKCYKILVPDVCKMTFPSKAFKLCEFVWVTAPPSPMLLLYYLASFHCIKQTDPSKSCPIYRSQTYYQQIYSWQVAVDLELNKQQHTNKLYQIYSTIPSYSTLPSYQWKDQILYNQLRIGHTHLTFLSYWTHRSS